MLKYIVPAAGFFALATTGAQASEWNERVDICAAAIEEQGLADMDNYRVDFVSGSGGSVKRVVVRLIPTADGERMTAQCRIKRGKLVDVELKT